MRVIHDSPYRPTNGNFGIIAESAVNNGFRTFRRLELALYHSLGKLPEPESTHEFV